MKDQVAGRYKISVVTPCYNSVSFLERIFGSLKNQSYKNIEWIAVDDCSTDNTVEYLQQLEERGELDMKIISMPINTRAVGATAEGIKNATGDFTIVLDHDDELMDEAILPLMETWENLGNNAQTPLYGIWGRCIDEYGKPIERSIDKAPLVCTNGELFHVLKLRNEWGSCFVKTGILKTFYVFDDNIKGANNGIIWNRIGQHYESILTNIVVRRYHTYVPGSMMRTMAIPFPAAMANQEAEYLDANKKYLKHDILFFLKKIILYLKYNHQSGKSLVYGITRLKGGFLQFLSFISLPVLAFIVVKNKLFK